MDVDKYVLFKNAMAGDTDAISGLVKMSDNLTTGNTILHVESRLGNKERVQFLTSDKFADKNWLIKTNQIGQTALHQAIEGGHPDVVAELIRAARSLLSSSANDFDGAFKNFLRKANNWNNTPLHLAVGDCNLDIVELLTAADPTDTHVPNTTGETPLYLAARLGYNDIVKIICRECIAPSLDGPAGATALHAAIRRLPKGSEEDLHGKTEIDMDVFKVLIDAAKRSSRSEDASQEGFQALLDKTDSDNATILDLAVSENHRDVVELILYKHPAYEPERVDSKRSYLLGLINIASTKRYYRTFKELCYTYEGPVSALLIHLLILVGCYVPEFIKHKKVDKTLRNDYNYTAYDMLYCEDAVIGHQVYIKEALDDTQESNQHCTVYDLLQRWKFWGRSITGKSDRPQCVVPESVVPERRKSKKDQAFGTAKRTLIENERVRIKNVLEKYRSRTNTQIVVTALITTISFTVGFTMPGGYHQSGEPDEGLTLLSKKKSFHFFIVSDALALALSTTTLFIYFISSMHDDPDQVSKLDATSTVLNMVSVIAMMFTFMAGSFVVLSHSPGLTIPIC